MGIDTETGSRFFSTGDRTIRHVEKHQDIPMEFIYLDGQSGREFDVRDLPEKYFQNLRAAVLEGNRPAHRAVIMRAIEDGYNFDARPAAATAKAPARTADWLQVHDRLLKLYKRANEYADLLDAAGNHEKAEAVREEAREVARNHDLDKLLKLPRS